MSSVPSRAQTAEARCSVAGLWIHAKLAKHVSQPQRGKDYRVCTCSPLRKESRKQMVLVTRQKAESRSWSSESVGTAGREGPGVCAWDAIEREGPGVCAWDETWHREPRTRVGS